jgi:hypothetical protein
MLPALSMPTKEICRITRMHEVSITALDGLDSLAPKDQHSKRMSRSILRLQKPEQQVETGRRRQCGPGPRRQRQTGKGQKSPP